MYQATLLLHFILQQWATVTLEMQHLAIRSVCSAVMEELTKSNQTGQGFPVASAIVDRLSFLLPSSRLDIMKEPVNRALMYSEAARRETFVNWPHMNYKYLPFSFFMATELNICICLFCRDTVFIVYAV